MKKIILFFLAVAMTTISYSQEIKISNDTLYYGKLKFFKGQKLKLGYGSTGTKDFAFIKVGNLLKTGIRQVKADNAKTGIIITSVYKADAGYMIKANTIEGLKYEEEYFIYAEGAVDNKELLIE
jgi:hypothetical protein